MPRVALLTSGPPCRAKKEEVLALWHGSFRLALQNIRAVKDEEGLEKRSVQNVNMKMRSEFKVRAADAVRVDELASLTPHLACDDRYAVLQKLDKSLGGDGKWVDSIKLAPGGSKKSSS